MNELLFQLLSRLGLELPPNEGQNPIAQALRTDPYTPDDEPYLRQFMGIPKNGGLTPTNLRPKSLTAKDNLPWFKPSYNIYESYNQSDLRKLLPTNTIDNLPANGVHKLLLPQFKAIPGLGHYTGSIGKNASGDPFLSIYDKWDFESPVIGPLVERLMGKVGQGFHIYDRYPLQRNRTGDNRGYSLRKDIELPSR